MTRFRAPTFFALASLAAGCAATALDMDADATASTLTAAECSTATAWTAWRTYATGALVTYGGATYRCLQGHTSQPDWTPSAVAALWSRVACAASPTPAPDAGAASADGGATATDAGTRTDASSGPVIADGGTCDPNAWVRMASDPNACAGHLGESCGWTDGNLGQGYHCQQLSWGVGCAPGGATCPASPVDGGVADAGSPMDGGTSGADAGTSTPDAGPVTGATASLLFGPYKDTSIHMNWNTNVVATNVSGSPTTFANDAVQAGARTLTLAFATGECGQESWGGVPGAAMAAANKGILDAAGAKVILSTGGAAGSFSCGSDSGMNAFLDRWAGPNLVGLDFDIEAGQSPAVIEALVARIRAAHVRYPNLRFSLTLATLAANQPGQTVARSLGSAAQDSLNVYGANTLNAVKRQLGWTGTEATWPRHVTVNLMTMDYGAAGPGICVVQNGRCQMGESALQAAYNLRDRWGVPLANIELTPMIGGNDVLDESFTLADAATVARFAITQGLAGVHYWSYDRDVDCAPGAASPTCNTLGTAGTRGFLRAFLAAGLR
jgi:chitinase